MTSSSATATCSWAKSAARRSPQFEYWKHTQLIIDVVPGRGGMFSLENGEGVRFLVRSRLFTDEEFAALQAQGKV